MREILNPCVDFLNLWGEPFWSFAGAMFVQETILVLVLLAIELVMRNRVRAVVRYALWLLVLVKLVLPVGLNTPASVAYWLPTSQGVPQPLDHAVGNRSPHSEVWSVASPVAGQAPLDPPSLHAAADLHETSPVSDKQPSTQPVQAALVVALPDEPRLHWKGTFFSLWILTVVALLAIVGRRALWVRRIVRQAARAPREIEDQLRESLALLGMPNCRVDLKMSDQLGSPAICGFRLPTILLPRRFPAGLDRQQVRMIFSHELVHWRRGDLQVTCCQTLLQVFYFYCPALWLANSIVRRLREQAVDETVLVALRGESERYASTLLDIASAALRPAEATLRLIGVVESRRALAARIRHILNRPIPRSSKLGFTGLVAIAVSGVLLLPMGQRESVALAQDKPSATKESDGNLAAVTSHEPTTAAKGQDIDGDVLPAGAIARLGTKRFRSSSRPVGILYPADGKSLIKITGGAWYGGLSSSALQQLDPISGRMLREKLFLENSPAVAASMAPAANVFATSRWSVDGAHNVTNVLEVFDLSSGGQKMELRTPGRPIVRLALSPDGNTLAYVEKNLHLIDIVSKNEIASQELVGGRVGSLAFSGGNSMLAVGGPARVLIWKWDSKDKPRSITIPLQSWSNPSDIAAVAFSPDGTMVAVGSNDTGPKGVLLFDAASGQKLRSFAVPGVERWYFRVVAFSPNGKLLAADIEDNSGNGVALWEVSTGKLVRRLRGLFGDAYYLAFSPDGRQLAASGDRNATMCVWNLETGKPLGADLPGHVRPPNTIRFLPGDRQLATAGDDYTIRIWDVADSRESRVMQHIREDGTYNSGVRGMDVSPDGKYVVSSSFDDTVRLWEVATGREVYRLPGHGHSGGHRAVRFTPDSKLFASWGDDMRVYLWDVATGKAAQEFVSRPAGLKMDRDETGNPPFSGPGSGPQLEAACFSLDASILNLYLDGLRRFSVRTGEELPKIDCRGGQASRIANSPDNRYLLWNALGKSEKLALKDGSGSRMVTKNYPVELRSLPDGKLVTALDLPGQWADVMAFSPDGSLVAMSVIDDQYRIELRKIPDLSEVARINLPSRAWAVEFSHSGKLLATSVSDSTVLVWDLDHLPEAKKP